MLKRDRYPQIQENHIWMLNQQSGLTPAERGSLADLYMKAIAALKGEKQHVRDESVVVMASQADVTAVKKSNGWFVRLISSGNTIQMNFGTMSGIECVANGSASALTWSGGLLKADVKASPAGMATVD
jgi:hypothetical protein